MLSGVQDKKVEPAVIKTVVPVPETKPKPIHTKGDLERAGSGVTLTDKMIPAVVTTCNVAGDQKEFLNRANTIYHKNWRDFNSKLSWSQWLNYPAKDYAEKSQQIFADAEIKACQSFANK